MPDLKVVAERSEKQIKEHEATRALKQALVKLAANLIRVVRGAGNPDLIMQHLRDTAVAYINWEDVHRRPATAGELGNLLDFPEPKLIGNEWSDGTVMTEYAICRNALQIVASTLLGQQRQCANAHMALRQVIESELERRAKRDKESRRTQRLAAKSKPAKRRSKARPTRPFTL